MSEKYANSYADSLIHEATQTIVGYSDSLLATRGLEGVLDSSYLPRYSNNSQTLNPKGIRLFNIYYYKPHYIFNSQN